MRVALGACDAWAITAPGSQDDRLAGPWLALLLALVFVSGAAALMAEILWVRGLGLQFGTSAPAIATVLAAFMGGLALGNLVVGPRADRHPHPLQLVRRVEVGIGLTGLAVSLLLLRGDVILHPLARLLADAGAARTPLRLLLFGGVMLVPATLMGGTLPALARILMRGGVPGRAMGTLYAVNTLGAVAGALLPDLWLIPTVGLTVTALIAAAGNLVVAGALGLLPLRALGPAPTVARRLPRLPLVLYGASGLCAMGYEVLWSRVHHHWSMGQAASFAVLLAVFLVALSVGSWLAAPWADRARRPTAVAAALLALTGPAAFAPILFADRWSEAYNRLLPSIRGVHRATPFEAIALATANSLFLEGTACLLMGAAFPFLAAAVVQHDDPGRATGRLVASNTLCGVVGSVLAGFVLLPLLGVQAALLILAALSLGVGGVALLMLWPRLPAVGLLVPAALLLVVGARLPPDHLRAAYFASFHGADTHILELREGVTTTAAVARRLRYGEPAHLQLLTPGVTMSDTQVGAQRYMGLMGHLPLLHSTEASEALLICFGVGNTARALLSHPTLTRLDVVDIAEEVLGMSGRFAEVHGSDPLDDPRVEVLVEDGRQHLITTARRYDVITAEPPPPTDAGVVNLYTREFYATARARMKPGGVLAQWLPLFQLAEAESAAIIAAFVAEFPHTALHYGYRTQWILLGSDAPLTVDADVWRGRLAAPSVDADLVRIGAAGLDALLDTRLQDDAGLRRAMRDVAPLTDDLPTLQYPRVGLAGHVEVPAGLVGRTSPVIDALPALTVRPFALRALLLARGLGPALAADPDDPHLQSLLRVGRDWSRPARVHRARGGGDPDAAFVLARLAWHQGRWEDALEQLDRIDPAGVDPVEHALLRGGALRAVGRGGEARAAFAQAARGTESRALQAELVALQDAVDRSWTPASGPLVQSDRERLRRPLADPMLDAGGQP